MIGTLHLHCCHRHLSFSHVLFPPVTPVLLSFSWDFYQLFSPILFVSSFPCRNLLRNTVDISSSCQDVSGIYRDNLTIRTKFSQNLCCSSVTFFIFPSKCRQYHSTVGKIEVYIRSCQTFSLFPDILAFFKYISFQFLSGHADRVIRDRKFMHSDFSSLCICLSFQISQTRHG